MQSGQQRAEVDPSFVTAALQSAPAMADPFPHLVARPVFTQNGYRDLLGHLPQRGYLPWTKASRVRQEQYEFREQVQLNDEWLSDLPTDLRSYWQTFSGWLLSEDFSRAVLSKFEDHLEPGMVSQVPRLKPDAWLLRHRAGYYLGPHTDKRARLVTLLFFLPRNDAMPELGTSLYRHQDNSFRSDGRLHHEFRDFVKLKTIPFLTNTLFAFVRTDVSFHGVEPLTTASKDVYRDMLQYTIYRASD